MLLVAAVGDLWVLDRSESPLDTVLTVFLLLAAAAIPVRPRAIGWAFLLLDTTLGGASSVPVGMLGYACVAAFFLWGWKKYFMDVAIGAPVLLIGFWVGSPSEPLSAIMLLIMISVAFVAGYVMRQYVEERDDAVRQLWQRELQQVKQAQQMRDALAVRLHDSLAGTLSVVTKVAESLRNEIPQHSGLGAKADLLEEKARDSLRELREIIQLLDSPIQSSNQEHDLLDTLRSMEKIVSAVGVKIQLEYEARELQHLSAAHSGVISSFLREVSTNLVKYAIPASTAFISVHRSTNEIEIMAKNQYLDEIRDAVLSSGKGLRTLREKFELAGGELDVWAAENWWFVRGELPVVKGEERAHE